MFDNMTVNDDGTITIVEDTGGSAHNGKMWLYDPATGTFKIIARNDPARFGNIVNGVAVNGSLTNDEEMSGVIDITAILNKGDGKSYYLFDLQNHLGSANPALVEGGQLMVAAVPEPSTYVMLGAGLGLIGFAARRRKNRK